VVAADAEEAARQEDHHRVLGFRVLAGRAVRADMLERFAAALRQAQREAGKTDEGAPLPPDLCPMLGVSLDDAEALCRALGFRTWRDDAGAVRFRTDRGRRRADARKDRTRTDAETEAERRRRLARGPARAADSPFAVLAERVRA
jgi:ATP-dependent RNA helicase SUPV3L1/SUV3